MKQRRHLNMPAVVQLLDDARRLCQGRKLDLRHSLVGKNRHGGIVVQLMFERNGQRALDWWPTSGRFLAYPSNFTGEEQDLLAVVMTAQAAADGHFAWPGGQDLDAQLDAALRRDQRNEPCYCAT